MARRRIRREEPVRNDSWINTYADMVTLLMTFFILLFSMSAVNIKKFQEVLSSLQGAFGILDGSQHGTPAPGPVDPSGLDPDLSLLAEEIARLENLAVKLREELAGTDFENRVSLEMEERGLVVRFADSVLFDLGSADIREEGQGVLAQVAGLLAPLDNPIRIEGHTDNLPINTPRFPSNWELSTGRATSVIRFLLLRSSIEPERLQAAGYGEYHPIDSNLTPEGRQRNRRVDVVILKESLSELEPR